MAKIVVTGYGTAGDFVPLLALAEALRDRGHHVLAAVNPWAESLFRNAGLETMPVGPRFGPEEAAAHQGLFDGSLRWTPTVDDEVADLTDWPRHYRQLAASCRAHGAELLVAGATLYAASWVAEDVGIPWVSVHGSDAATQGVPDGKAPQGRPPLMLALTSRSMGPRPDLQAPGPMGFAHPNVHMQPGWSEPSTELRTFLGSVGRAGGARPRRWLDGPLVLLPGSTPLPDPVATVRAHVGAAAALGRRLVVQSGWAGLSRKMLEAGAATDHVYFAEVLPQDWLLRRAAAAFVSGRPGTLSRALCAGCPVLVEPRGRDAFANGGRVLESGVGAVLDPQRMSAQSIRRILEERILLPAARRRCARLARRLAAEDGATRAREAVEAWLGGRS